MNDPMLTGDRPVDVPPPPARPAPATLYATVGRLAAERRGSSRSRAGIRTVAAATTATCVIGLGIAGAVQLGGPSHQLAPAGPFAATPSAAGTPLAAADADHQRDRCLDRLGGAAAQRSWTTAYARRVAVLGSSRQRSVLVLRSADRYLTCVDGRPGRQGTLVAPAAGTAGVFGWVDATPTDDGYRMTFAADITDEGIAVQGRVVGPDGAGPWLTTPPTTGWVIMNIATGPAARRVEYRAVDSSGQPVKLTDPDSDRQPAGFTVAVGGR